MSDRHITVPFDKPPPPPADHYVKPYLSWGSSERKPIVYERPVALPYTFPAPHIRKPPAPPRGEYCKPCIRGPNVVIPEPDPPLEQFEVRHLYIDRYAATCEPRWNHKPVLEKFVAAKNERAKSFAKGTGRAPKIMLCGRTATSGGAKVFDGFTVDDRGNHVFVGGAAEATYDDGGKRPWILDDEKEIVPASWGSWFASLFS